MKNLTKKIVGSLLIVFAFIGTHDVMASHLEKIDSHTITAKDNLVGTWEYTVEGAPQGYEIGFLVIAKTDEKYTVQVQLEHGNMNGTDVVVEKNNITFKLVVEGEYVTIALAANGDQMTGTSTSSSGSYTIKGVKHIIPQ